MKKVDLRPAGEELSGVPASKRAAEISRLAKSWLEPKGAWRIKAVRALSRENGYPPGMTHAILDNLFSKFTGPRLKLAGESARRLHRDTDRVTGLIFPANVPDPIVVNLFLCLLSGSAAWMRFSERAPAFGRLFAESLSRSPLFRKAVAMASSKDHFFAGLDSADAVIAFGTDETMRAIEDKLGSRTRFAKYGHALSAGVIFSGSLAPRALEETVRGCARDVWLYDQRGCFSPQVYFVEKEGAAFAEKLHAELTRLEKEHGRVRRNYDIAVERRVLIDRLRGAAVDASRVRFLGDIGGGPVVYELRKDGFTLASTGQVVGVKGFQTPADILESLGPIRHYLRCVSVAGTPAQTAAIRRLFTSSSVGRFCRPGEMQNPPISAVV